MSRAVAVAVSGGVDSLVAAHLLKQDDPRVVLVHFRTGFEPEPAERALARIHALGGRLDLPLHVLDLGEEFKREVVDYFTAAYLSGQTPNPCMVCILRIPFSSLLQRAGRLGRGLARVVGSPKRSSIARGV